MRAPATIPEVPAPADEVGRSRSHPLARFVARRLLSGLAALVVATILIFVALQVLPSNVAEVVLGRAATPQRLAEAEQELGLEKSLPARYVSFVKGMVTGDFGNSSAALVAGRHESVWGLIKTPLRNSLMLALITIVIFIPLCLSLGVLSGVRAGKKTDHAISLFSLLFVALPEFLVGTLLIALFFTQMNVLPAVSPIAPGETPFSHPDQLILPVLTLLVVSLAFGTRLVRASTIEILREDFVSMARLNGIAERRVIGRFALRNAIAPSIQILAQEVQYLIGGIIIVESVFDYPGIGTSLVRAVQVRDFQEIAVISTLLAAMYILINVIADIAVVLLVPKLRTDI